VIVFATILPFICILHRLKSIAWPSDIVKVKRTISNREDSVAFSPVHIDVDAITASRRPPKRLNGGNDAYPNDDHIAQYNLAVRQPHARCPPAVPQCDRLALRVERQLPESVFCFIETRKSLSAHGKYPVLDSRIVTRLPSVTSAAAASRRCNAADDADSARTI